MQEEVIIRRRNRLKKHFVNVSNVLLYGYTTLTDGAKITYQVIDGFDWEDKETEDSKGFVFPAIETIAEIRNAAKRTIFRHIQELEKVGLLTRIRRRNKPSILYIEEVSDEEANAYLNRYVEKQKNTEAKPEAMTESRNAKNGTSDKAREMPKMAVAYMKEDEKKENEINVNAHFQKTEEKKRYTMQGIGDLLKWFETDGCKDRMDRHSLPLQTSLLPGPQTRKPANGHPGKKPRKTTRVQNGKTTKPEEKIQRDYFATHIASILDDEKSLGCYRIIAEKVPQPILFETLSSVKETWQEGKIHKSRGALFVDLIKSYCKKNHIDLNFSEEAQAHTSRHRNKPVHF